MSWFSTFVTKFYYITKNLVFIVLVFAVFRMRICTSVTDHEVARAKNLLKTNILMQLDGMFLFGLFFSFLFVVKNKQKN